MRKRFAWQATASLALLIVEQWISGLWNQPQTELNGSNNRRKPADPYQPDGAFEPSPKEGWNPEEKEHRRWERGYWLAYVILTALVAVGAGFSARYAYKAAHEAHEQVRAALKANEMNAESGRAWVGPVDAILDRLPAIGSPVIINITFQNAGKEPALDLIRYAENDLVETGEVQGLLPSDALAKRLFNCLLQQPVEGGQVAWPTIGQASFTLFDQINASPIENSVRSGTKALAITTCFAYMAAGKLRHTSQCFYYEPGVSKIEHLNICNVGNHAD